MFTPFWFVLCPASCRISFVECSYDLVCSRAYSIISALCVCRFLFSDSEPPDIRNWFSSYVYESPESDTCSLLRDEVSEENQRGKTFDFVVVKADGSRSANGHPKGCVEHNNSFDKNTKVKAKAALIQGAQHSFFILLKPFIFLITLIYHMFT